MSETNQKPEGKPSSANRKKLASELVTHYVEQLAMVLGQLIPPERIILYARALSDLTEKQLEHGFEKALKYFKPEYGKTFPAPAEIREWAYQWRAEAISDSQRILDRGDKPPDWEPLKAGELDEMRQRSRKVEREIEIAAKEIVMPKPDPMTDVEFDRRRRMQLEEFRQKNKLTGEA